MAAQGRQRLVTRVLVHDTSQRPHAPWPFTGKPGTAGWDGNRQWLRRQSEVGTINSRSSTAKRRGAVRSLSDLAR